MHFFVFVSSESPPGKPRFFSTESESRRLFASYNGPCGARCEEGSRRARTIGGKRCSHGKRKSDCAACNPCPHGKVKGNRTDCNPCPHGKRKSSCAACSPCPHGKVKCWCAACKAACPNPPISKRIKREPESSPEIKQEPEPFTIRSYFGIGE